MMAIPPSEVRDMVWWEYQALLWNWNDRHSSESTEEVEAPNMDAVMLQFAKIERSGLARSIH